MFFAGEATNVGHLVTAHSAIQSGQHDAKEILVSLRIIAAVKRGDVIKRRKRVISSQARM
jgi:hypothetical protein